MKKRTNSCLIPRYESDFTRDKEARASRIRDSLLAQIKQVDDFSSDDEQGHLRERRANLERYLRGFPDYFARKNIPLLVKCAGKFSKIHPEIAYDELISQGF